MSKKYNTKALYFTDKLKYKLSDIIYYPLTIMEAPCGYGKTVAADEFLNKLDAKVLWMILDNNSMSDFWMKFCHSLSYIDKDIALKIKQLDIPKDKISLEEFFILFRDIDFSEETILVIDNLQFVQNEIINNFIRKIAEKLCKNMHIVIITQNRSLENTLDMILKKKLNHITKAYFEFDASEIEKYYKLCGISLNESEAINLYKYCGGWISVLYIQMLDYIETQNFQCADNVYFLVEKVLNNKFSEKTQKKFLKLCLFESFTIEKLKFIFDSTDVSDFINEIHNSNIFIKYDSDKKVDQVLIDKIVEAARIAPTSSGLQPFEVIVISNQELKDKIVPITLGQEIVAECSHLLVFAAWDDYTAERIDNIYSYITKERNQPADRYQAYTDRLKSMYLNRPAEENFAHAARQAYIAFGVGIVAAMNEEVDATPMEGFSAEALDKILGLPEQNLGSTTILTLGYRDEPNDNLVHAAKVRKSKSTLFEFK